FIIRDCQPICCTELQSGFFILVSQTPSLGYYQFLKTLSPQELLSVRIYRSAELSAEKKKVFDNTIVQYGISEADYERLTQEEKERNKGTDICPRCFSAKTASDLLEKYPNFRTLYSAWRYVPGSISYTRNCQVCAHVFNKKVPFRYYVKLFRKHYL